MLVLAPLKQDSNYFAGKLIVTSQWLLIIRESEAQVLAPIYQQLLNTTMLALVGMIPLSLWFINTISVRFKRAMTKRQGEVNSAVVIVNDGFIKTQSAVRKSDNICHHMTQVAKAVEQQSVTSEEINSNISTIRHAANELATFTA